ncbi:MAG: phosphoribosylformylglycinamidine synthase, partial [Candidatus Eremiobacteraeota bacterium]|nr:phosphoribosylformylglycinamidine synthase [Candidatus Eremiobacteraeota bacterium]
ELGGSVIAELLGIATTTLPSVDYGAFSAWCDVVRDAYAQNIVLAARDISDGGVLTAVAEMAIASEGVGVTLREDPVHLRHEALWFAESPGFVLQVSDADALFAVCARHDTWALEIGTTSDDGRLVYRHNDAEGRAVNDEIAVAALREAWEAPLRDFYGSVA